MEKTLQRRACAKTGSKNGSTAVQEEKEAGRAPGNRWKRRTEGDEAALGQGQSNRGLRQPQEGCPLHPKRNWESEEGAE